MTTKVSCKYQSGRSILTHLLVMGRQPSKRQLELEVRKAARSSLLHRKGVTIQRVTDKGTYVKVLDRRSTVNGEEDFPQECVEVVQPQEKAPRADGQEVKEEQTQVRSYFRQQPNSYPSDRLGRSWRDSWQYLINFRN
jgi:hypothetical protein